MNILFRADSSSAIGTGHIMRDLVLASQYEKDANIIFAAQNLKGNINHKIEEAGYRIELLDSNDIDEIEKLIEKHQIDMIVIDHYEIDWQYEKQLKERFPDLTIMSFDDTYKNHYCDILLNHNICADEKRYTGLVPDFCELRCGVKYTLLREEFKREKEIKREKVYDVFVAMGGSDSANLNIPILEALPQALKVCVVTTEANANLKCLEEYVNTRDNVSLFVNSNEVAKLMNQSRFAVITPSVTANEISFMDVPFIAIQVAKNQAYMTEFLHQKHKNILEKFDPDIFHNKLAKVLTNGF